jgi:hypothetical protein
MSEPNQVEDDRPDKLAARQARAQALRHADALQPRSRFHRFLGNAVAIAVGLMVLVALAPMWMQETHPAAHSARLERENRQRLIEQAVRHAQIDDRAPLPAAVSESSAVPRALAAD